MKLNINGVLKTINSDPDTPLLWVIRDELKLTGTKFGCGAGLCGACTVHLNGVAIRSCITPISSVENDSISTIESLSPDSSSLSLLQENWVKFNVPQCGYCQSGQLMSASALLSSNSNPSDDDIDLAMSGNICRCGTYPRIKAAIKATASSNHSLDLSYEVPVR
tara:strand:+ start:4383 stop:4874 length:492 start_codon:yes stop_codon:yes gene_type:complete